jgi:hypothetical protein
VVLATLARPSPFGRRMPNIATGWRSTAPFDGQLQCPSIQGRIDFFRVVWNFPSFGTSTLRFDLPSFTPGFVPQPHRLPQLWLVRTAGSCWLFSFRAWACRTFEAKTARLGDVTCLAALRLHSGHCIGRLRWAMGRSSAKGPHSAHSNS